MEKNIQKEFKEVGLKVKAIFIVEVKLTDSVEKFNYAMKMDREIHRCPVFFVNKKSEIIPRWDIKNEDYPIKLYALPVTKDIGQLLKDIDEVLDLPF